MVLRRVAVTGASGMVGGYLLALLRKQGVAVVATSRRRPAYLTASDRWFSWDLRRRVSTRELQRKFGRVDALFHVGAIARSLSGAADEGLADLLDANVRACLCLGVWTLSTDTPFVHLSGGIVYRGADSKRHITEKAPTGSSDIGGFYGFSKWLAEETLECLRKQGLRLAVLRASSIYGRRMEKTKMLPRFLKVARSGGDLEVAPPWDRVDLIHAADVAEAMVQAARKEAWGTFNIAGGRLYSVPDIARACSRVAGKGRLKQQEAVERRAPRVRFELSTKAAHRAFGFRPSFDLDKGLREMQREFQE